jgi:N-carbamoyl-L-amino-acid hydrolase
MNLQEALTELAQQCAEAHDLTASVSITSMTDPTDTDPYVAQSIEQQAKHLGLSTRRISSGAAHDSQVIATRAPTAMIFVPSRDGRSHSKLEKTAWEDVVNGANVLLATLIEQAQ